MANPQDADLHHAISMRPHPFHQHPPESSLAPPTHSYLPVLGPDNPSAHTTTTTITPKNPSHSHTSAMESATTSNAGPPRQRPVFTSRNSIDEGDVERGDSLPAYTDANDPYSLRHALKSDEDIESIRANMARKRTSTAVLCGMEAVKPWQGRKMKAFYERQNESIGLLLKPVEDLVCITLSFNATLYLRT
jgi:hypothetical protein